AFPGEPEDFEDYKDIEGWHPTGHYLMSVLGSYKNTTPDVSQVAPIPSTGITYQAQWIHRHQPGSSAHITPEVYTIGDDMNLRGGSKEEYMSFERACIRGTRRRKRMRSNYSRASTLDIVVPVVESVFPLRIIACYTTTLLTLLLGSDYRPVFRLLFSFPPEVHETRFQMQQAELAALRENWTIASRPIGFEEQQRRARQPGPEARIPDYHDASGDADNHIHQICADPKNVFGGMRLLVGQRLEDQKLPAPTQKGQVEGKPYGGIFAQVHQVPSSPQWPMHPEVPQVQQMWSSQSIFMRDCPKLKNKDGGNGNAQGWVYAVGNAEKRGNASGNPDANVVTALSPAGKANVLDDLHGAIRTGWSHFGFVLVIDNWLGLPKPDYRSSYRSQKPENLVNETLCGYNQNGILPKERLEPRVQMGTYVYTGRSWLLASRDVRIAEIRVMAEEDNDSKKRLRRLDEYINKRWFAKFVKKLRISLYTTHSTNTPVNYFGHRSTSWPVMRAPSYAIRVVVVP
ncbi:hypothetical protein Tco_0696207, partial [Tanacetum coccineum]